MAQTKLTNLINPEVIGDMISAGLPKAIKFAPLAKIDTTLVGQPGNTITVPKFAYIGDAEDVAEGVAMGTVVLTASSTQATVKKAGKAVEITDESVLSGYGDPVGEANSQLLKSIASKVDNDCVTALGSATLTYDGSAAVIAYNGVVDAVDKFQEEDYEAKV
ncbi:MAG: N4-gp56 family major capsid protein, partial [Bacilli bacterium]